jgi:starch phosphorylase
MNPALLRKGRAVSEPNLIEELAMIEAGKILRSTPLITGKGPFVQRLRSFVRAHEGKKLVGYFCMEYGLNSRIPLFGGGLGVLAGDTLKSCADLGLPVVGVGLLYREGNFHQKFDKNDWQTLEPVEWDPKKEEMEDLGIIIKVPLNGAQADFKLWGYWVKGEKGGVPLILLDSAVEANKNEYYDITKSLYAEGWFKLVQRVALGVGGMMALESLGLEPDIVHLNEGHGAFACAYAAVKKGIKSVNEELRRGFVFTTHTSEPAAFDRFFLEDIKKVFSSFPEVRDFILNVGREGDMVNLALIGMDSSSKINAVSKLHAEVSRDKFSSWKSEIASKIFSITNGVHHLTWTSLPFKRLYDKWCPQWWEDPKKLYELLKYRFDANFQEALWTAHQQAKRLLLRFVKEATGKKFEEEVLTIGFARRAAGYKRANLLFSHLDWLISLAQRKGRVQLIFAGKAHQVDHYGKKIIQEVRKNLAGLSGVVEGVFIDDYDMDKAKLLVSGSDIWLNNPFPPREASGTSGMKAAFNGVPQLSTNDGWWAEAERDLGGWTFGVRSSSFLGEVDYSRIDASALYYALEEIVPLYYQLIAKVKTGKFGGYLPFLDKMIHALALNASYFNTHRMVLEYASKVWEIEV